MFHKITNDSVIHSMLLLTLTVILFNGVTIGLYEKFKDKVLISNFTTFVSIFYRNKNKQNHESEYYKNGNTT